jgi:Carboxypeptidase regulatory-like domain
MKSAFLLMLAVACASAALAQANGQTPAPVTAQPKMPAAGQAAAGQLPGSVSGTITDPSGAVVEGARVQLTEGPSFSKEAVSDHYGRFSFMQIPPGRFQLTVLATGLAKGTFTGELHSEQLYLVPEIVLPVATAVTEVKVGVAGPEVAEQQIKMEEKQRVLAVIPNFYVSYVPNAAPLNASQKFRLAARTAIDPFTLVMAAGTAGVQQAQNHFVAYGQGAQGYAKRFGADYADIASGIFIGSAALPVLFKQDPRYFYKGTGSVPSRFFYAISSALVCKGDNGRWQPNYSNVLGSLAAGGLSNLYYPEQNRNGVGLTLENGAIGIMATAAGNVFQEFVVRKLTPKLPKRDASNKP